MARVAHAFGDDAVAIPTDGLADALALSEALASLPSVLEAVPGHGRVVAHARSAAERDLVLEHARQLAAGVHRARPPARLHVVRVVYDGADLVEVAGALGLSCGEVAERHAASSFFAELVGFLPGFAYLAGLDPSLERPRRASPRPRVAPGAVAIAGLRSGIYPLASPGGWNLLGRAIDFVAFDPARDPPALFAVGDRVQFVIEDVRP